MLLMENLRLMGQRSKGVLRKERNAASNNCGQASGSAGLG